MMVNFTWLNKQGVRSDTGYELQRLDRFTMEYREGNNAITIDIESGILDGNSPAVLMSPDALKVWDSGRFIDAPKQSQILENIRKALAFQEMGLSVE